MKYGKYLENSGLFTSKYSLEEIEFILKYADENELERAIAGLLSVDNLRARVKTEKFACLSRLTPYRKIEISEVGCQLDSPNHGQVEARISSASSYSSYEWAVLKSIIGYVQGIFPEATFKLRTHSLSRECPLCETIHREEVVIEIVSDGYTFSKGFALSLRNDNK